jgi:hypothetical protein
MKIPVFVSCPTDLNDSQKKSRTVIIDELDDLGLEPRAVGRSDYPTDLPMREVLVLARRCAGGVILGFGQMRVRTGVSKPGTANEKRLTSIDLASPWNQIEAGILFSFGLPLLIFREEGIQGGVFDLGTGDVFIQRMPPPDPTDELRESLHEICLRWQAHVRGIYYDR